MIERKHVYSGMPWEPVVGYCRALRAGTLISVSGTTATDEHGEVVGEGDAKAQARQALRNLVHALSEFGAGPQHVVRTRMYVTDITKWREFGEAHGEVFCHIRPATSMVQVSALIDPRMMFEIEADALIEDD